MHISTAHLFIAGFFTFIMAINVIVVTRAFRRSRLFLQNWADAHGCSVLEKRFCFFKGPFFWSSGRSDLVYRLTIRDASGQTQSGWVKIGSGWLGIWTPAAPVTWKGESGAPPPMPVTAPPAGR